MPYLKQQRNENHCRQHTQKRPFQLLRNRHTLYSFLKRNGCAASPVDWRSSVHTTGSVMKHEGGLVPTNLETLSTDGSPEHSHTNDSRVTAVSLSLLCDESVQLVTIVTLRHNCDDHIK